MTRDEKILALLRKITKDRHCFVGQVLDNHPDEQFIEVMDPSTGAEYPDVRKKASINEEESGLLITPANDSYVIVSRIDSTDELFVEMVSEIETYTLVAGKDVTLDSREGAIKVVAKQGVAIDGADGKVSIGNNEASLLELLQDLVGVIKGVTVMTSDGPCPLETTSITQLEQASSKFEKLLSDE